MKKRILSMLLVLVLMATLVPVSASAAVTIYWPVPGHTRLSQGYHANNAIDISDGSINGATVIAAASGTVTHIYLCSNTHNDSYSIQHPESTDCNGFGTGLVIKADDGRIYQYAHMQGRKYSIECVSWCICYCRSNNRKSWRYRLCDWAASAFWHIYNAE